MKKNAIFSAAVFLVSWATTGAIADPAIQNSGLQTHSSRLQSSAIQSSAIQSSPIQRNGFIKASYRSDQQRFHAAGIVDRILVEKTKRRLTLLSDGDVLKQYKISLGREPVGPKLRAGDNRTPEGLYYIDYRIRKSDYHMALHISYPNPNDVDRAEQMGYSPGGSIMLHGLKNDDQEIAYYHGYFDWTKGCIAVTNTEIEEIWRLVPNGTPIEIRP